MNKIALLLLFLTLCHLVCSTDLTQSATITVVNLNDSGPGSLRQAILDAAPSDMIDFAVTGTITLISGQLVIAQNLTIYGPGSDLLTIDGNHLGRVFNITAGQASISYMTITNGYADMGAGIMNSSTLWLFNSVISNHHAENNSGAAYGGGIMNEGSLHIENCTITGNNVSSFMSPDVYGGGLYNSASGTAHLYSSTFSANEALMPGVGGAVSMPAAGGGTITVTNSTFYGNASGAGGAALFCDSGLSMVNCTVVQNDTVGNGGGIYSISSPGPVLQNTIVANNTSPSTGNDVFGAIQSSDYNLIEDIAGATISGLTMHNIYNQDPILEPLADNGGSTLTCAVPTGSPVLDYIPQSDCAVYNDQRNVIRPQHDMCEIGSYEKSYFAATYINAGITSPTNADTIPFMVSFNHLAYQFNDESDLIITETGTVQHTGASGFAGGMNFAVSIDGVTGDGEMTVAVSTTSDVVDELGNPLEYSVISHPILIDNTGPAITVVLNDPPIFFGSTAFFRLDYTGADTITLTESDISIRTTETLLVSDIEITAENDNRWIHLTVSGQGAFYATIACCTAVDALGNQSDPIAETYCGYVFSGAYVPIEPWAILLLLISMSILFIRLR